MNETRLFVDGVMEANVLNGVVRITLGQAGADGKPVPCGQLLVPLVQLPSLTNGLVNLVRQIESRVKEASEKSKTADGAAPVATDGQAAPAAAPASFTFQKG